MANIGSLVGFLTLNARQFSAELGKQKKGVEGFAGSAIQIQFLKERIGGPELPRSFGVLLIHALNPYGFAHLRRANECNVDLNRNFVDFAQPLPENPYARTTTPRFSTKDCASTTRRRQP